MLPPTKDERQAHAALANTRGVSKRLAKEGLESGSDLIDSVSPFSQYRFQPVIYLLVLPKAQSRENS
jgi:hypothetical protein